MRLTQIIEALLFASDAPLTAADLARIDERLDEDTVTAVVDELRSEYDLSERSFQIYDVAGGYQILTRPEFVGVLERYDTVPQSTRLSTPALEVLAIIAYRQPLGRSEVEEIRGVQSAAVLRTLQDRGLIEPVGRSEALGRPLLYGTTSRFLDHFGFRSLEDLPRPDELPVVLRTRQPAAEAAARPEETSAVPDVQPEPVAGPEAAAPDDTADLAPPTAADANAQEVTEPARPGTLTDVDEPAETGGEPVHTAAAAEQVVASAESTHASGADSGSQSGDDGADEASHDEAADVEEGEAQAATIREG